MRPVENPRTKPPPRMGLPAVGAVPGRVHARGAAARVEGGWPWRRGLSGLARRLLPKHPPPSAWPPGGQREMAARRRRRRSREGESGRSGPLRGATAHALATPRQRASGALALRAPPDECTAHTAEKLPGAAWLFGRSERMWHKEADVLLVSERTAAGGQN